MICESKSKPEILLNKSFLEEISKRKEIQGILISAARNAEKRRRMIDQINFLWSNLPAHVQENSDIRTRLTSIRDDDFLGALGEICIYWVLQKIGVQIEFGAKVGTKTPDLKITSPEETYIEVFSEGYADIEEKQSRLFNEIERELRKLGLKNYIEIIGNIIPNNDGNIHGLSNKIITYLSSVHDLERRYHTVECRGAKVRFKVPNQNFTKGAVAHNSEPVLDLSPSEFRERVNKKAKKYKFPFIAASFWRSPDFEALDLQEAMFGKQNFVYSLPIDGVASGPMFQRMNNLNDGFWKQANGSSRSHRVAALLHTRFVLTFEGGFELHCFFTENPSSQINWGEVFNAVPKVTADLCDEQLEKLRPLILIPPMLEDSGIHLAFQ